MLQPLTAFLVPLATVALAATAPVAFAADPPKTASATVQAPATDEFLTKLAAGNKFEIDSSKLAISKTKSESVKAFANDMVKDHGQAGAKMKQAVTDAKAKAPPDQLDAKHQAIYDDLKKKDGTAFDQAFVDAQAKGHVETVAMVEAYAQGGDNPRIKAFAKDILPTLKTHLDKVKKLQASMGKS